MGSEHFSQKLLKSQNLNVEATRWYCLKISGRFQCLAVWGPLLWTSILGKKTCSLWGLISTHFPPLTPQWEGGQLAAMNAWGAKDWPLPKWGPIQWGNLCFRKSGGVKLELESHWDRIFALAPSLPQPPLPTLSSWVHPPSKSQAPGSPPGFCLRAPNSRHRSPSKYSLQTLSVDLLVVTVIKFPRHRIHGL